MNLLRLVCQVILGLVFFMKLKLLTWNVRGLNDPKKWVVLKNWMRKWKVDIVCLQETKLDKVDGRVIHSIWGNRFAGWEVLNAVNTASGVLLLWDKQVVDRVDSKVGMFSVSCCWKSLVDGFEWVGTGVYGLNRDDSRSELWAELSEVRHQWSQPWCIFGDFNVVRFPSERGAMFELLLLWWNFLILLKGST